MPAHLPVIAAELATAIGLVPVVWLAVVRPRQADPAWFWLATAFTVSWVADTVARVVDPWLVSLTYPMSQAALVGFVVLSRRDAWTLLLALLVTALAAVVVRVETRGPDLLIHTVAWLSVVGIVWDRWALPVRGSLVAYFGLGWLAWVGYTLAPGWPTWIAHQGTRAVGIALFCAAARSTSPSLRLVRAS